MLWRIRTSASSACVPLAGARSLLLGAMRYRALASPGFMARHFPDGFDPAHLPRTPALVFGPDDYLQHRFLASLGLAEGFLHHLCPSSEGFNRLAKAGMGWGMVPELQVEDALAEGSLIEICVGLPVDVPLYWHHWRNGGQLLERLTQHLRDGAGSWLVPL
jgi:LysR family transcriptional regulator (chromosome initiation inhibitor)